MAQSDLAPACYFCNSKMDRDFQADLFHTSDDSYQTPIVSDSMAISMDQIAEHKRECPDIEITGEGQPVFRSYKQHEAYLKKTGFTKSPKKKRLNEKKIASQSDK
jgi:hypothetical protein